MTSDFITDLKRRGLFVQSTSPEIEAHLARGPATGYIGFDPTADSLHVGSLTQLINLMRFQRAGHRPIAVVGGATGLIGDPSGKESERTLLSREQLDANLVGMRAQIERYIDLAPGKGIVVNNFDWLGDLRLLDFLRDIGKHFSVNQMIARDSVRMRLETREHGISYTEFSYMLLQSYDFVALFDRYNCTLQMGATDQWGNIVSGADLVRRLRNTEVFGLTTPLVTRADGKKFGKSEGGNIWLDPRRTSPYQFYQFWINQEDADVERYLKMFTFLPVDEIDEVVRAHQAAPEQRKAQALLAAETTRLVHGEAALASAKRTTDVLFSRDGDLRSLSESELRDAFAGAPSTTLAAAKLGTHDASVVGVATDAGLYPSRGQAKKDLPNGALAINGAPATDITRVLTRADVLAGGFIILRKGKKHYHVVRISE